MLGKALVSKHHLPAKDWPKPRSDGVSSKKRMAAPKFRWDKVTGSCQEPFGWSPKSRVSVTMRLKEKAWGAEVGWKGAGMLPHPPQNPTPFQRFLHRFSSSPYTHHSQEHQLEKKHVEIPKGKILGMRTDKKHDPTRLAAKEKPCWTEMSMRILSHWLWSKRQNTLPPAFWYQLFSQIYQTTATFVRLDPPGKLKSVMRLVFWEHTKFTMDGESRWRTAHLRGMPLWVIKRDPCSH